MSETLLLGDCLSKLKELKDCSIENCITDPPYGLSNHTTDDIINALNYWLNNQEYNHNKKGFMGKQWDSFVPSPLIWKEVFRVLKPGGHLLCFAGSRTQDLMGISLRLAGFEIRDTIQWLYSSGFPKSTSISKAIDKQLNCYVPGEVLPTSRKVLPTSRKVDNEIFNTFKTKTAENPQSDEAKEWQGWGSALKPAYEPIIIARKPIEGTLAENAIKHKCGCINIDKCRVPLQSIDSSQLRTMHRTQKENTGWGMNCNSNDVATVVSEKGRWPANVILSHSENCKEECIGFKLDKQSGHLKSGTNCARTKDGSFVEHSLGKAGDVQTTYGDEGGASRFFSHIECDKSCPVKELEKYGTTKSACVKEQKEGYDSDSKFINGISNKENQYSDEGSVARFFYCAKASQKEKGKENTHVTVKPIALMQYLCKLIAAKDTTILDPFMGSGTTGLACELEGINFVGIEINEEYYNIAVKRIKEAKKDKDMFDIYGEEK